MSAFTDAYEMRGRTVVDRNGEKIGKLDEVYLDDHSNAPEWAAVNTGLFGMKSSLVPLAGAKPSGEDVQVAFTKDQVKDAPSVEPDGELSSDEETELFRHYGHEGDTGSTLPEATSPATGGRPGGGGDDAMTRSEEEVRVGTAERERGRARLRKYVVTVELTKTGPVRRVVDRSEREPITDANRDEAVGGPEISEAEHEVTLMAEEPVVEKRAVPKERVRLEKDVESEQAEVSETVRKERVDLEDGRSAGDR
jgi:stress response protein YsnF